MKLSYFLYYVCAYFILITNSNAYEIDTHAVITQQTVGRTVLSDNNYIKELGLDIYVNNLGLKYYDISGDDIIERSNDKFEDKIILKNLKEPIDSLKGWFMRGVIRE